MGHRTPSHLEHQPSRTNQHLWIVPTGIERLVVWIDIACSIQTVEIYRPVMRFSLSVAILSGVVGGVSAFVAPARHHVTALVSTSSSLNAESKARTLYDKIWDDHLVDDDGMSTLLYVDRHLVHEVTSPQAFEGLRLGGRGVRRPDCTLTTVDHNVPTEDRSQLIDVQTFIEESASRTQVMQLEQNVKDFGLKYFGMADERQGIVHIIGPEQGFTLPGCVTVCGDSHTATHGAFGALAFGIGTSEVEHVLATQVSSNETRGGRLCIHSSRLGDQFIYTFFFFGSIQRLCRKQRPRTC